MNSDGEITKTKLEYLNEIYNFVVDYHFIWTNSDGEMIRPKPIDLDDKCNLVVDEFFIWK